MRLLRLLGRPKDRTAMAALLAAKDKEMQRNKGGGGLGFFGGDSEIEEDAEVLLVEVSALGNRRDDSGADKVELPPEFLDEITQERHF